MFEKIGPNHVRSSWGFEVSVRREATQIYVEYREGNRVVLFDNTMNVASLGYPLFTLRPKYIAHWAPPFDGELLDQEKRKLIIGNLAVALDFMGITSDARDEQANVIGNFDSQGWVWKDEQWLNK
jgi:hypothetical protein